MTFGGWWSAFRDAPWTGTWPVYAGAWIFLAAIVLGYRALSVNVRRSGHPGPGRLHLAFLVSGILALWVALDGPVASLGASHLASVRMLQYLLVGIVAPAFLILSLPAGAFRMLAARHGALRLLRPLTHPVVALLLFNGGMTVTLWPSVANTLMASPVGSLVIHLTWLACGWILWWPVIAPVPAHPSFHPLLKVAYLGANVVFVMPPAAMMFFSQSPVYVLYPTAPDLAVTEAARLEALQDLRRAGAVQKVGSAWIFAVAMFVVAFRWYRSVREESEDPGLEVPSRER